MNITNGMNKLKQQINDVNLTSLTFCICMLFVFTAKTRFFNIGNYFVLPIAVIVFGLLELVRQRHINIKTEHLCVVLIFCLVFLNTFILGYGAQFDMIAATGLYFVFFIVVNSVEINKKSFDFIINGYVISAVILGLILLFQLEQPYQGQVRYGIFYSQTDFYDINFTACYMLVPSLISFNKVLITKDKIYRLINFIFATILFLAIALTGSRGAMIPYLIIVIILMIKYLKQNKLIKKSNIIYIFIGILLLLLLLPNETTSRFFTTSYISSNIRRLIDWQYGLKAVMIHPLFGNGMYSSLSIISNNFNEQVTAHNTFINILVQYGFIGAIPHIILYIYPIIKLLKMPNTFNICLYYFAFLFSITMIEANLSLIMLIPFTIFYIIVNFISKNIDHNKENIL